MNYHLIAIGGTGMGALAGLLRAAGHEVRGSDHGVYPPMSEQLSELQIPVFEGFSERNLDWGPDVVVVGNVCRKDHVEVVAAQARGLKLVSLPQVLGEVFLASRRSVVIAGTHGKTTTSSLVTQLLLDAGRDPGVFIGGVPLQLGRGWRLGDGEEFVVEGDEYDSAFFDKGSKFLHYRPRIAVLTSVELDHVDIFSSLDAVRDAFRAFVRLIPADGLLVANADSPDALAVARECAACPVETYAVEDGEPRDDSTTWVARDDSTTWVARKLSYRKTGRCRFELTREGQRVDRFEIMLAGTHNVANACAAIAVAHALGLSPEQIKSSVHQFAGVTRRQELRGIANGVTVIDDYAHHPTAVRETLRGLRRRYPDRRLVAVFEPRSATSRRATFQDAYVDALSHADAVVVARLSSRAGIPEDDMLDPERLAMDLHGQRTPASYIADTADVVAHLVDSARPGDVLCVLSSGSFDGIHDRLLAALGDPVRPARRRDMAAVRDLAGAHRLLAGGITDDDHRNFFVLYNEHGFAGCVGLEVYGPAAILRSLAVKQEARGVGYGWLLADTVIQTARARGVKRVYLLTESASDYFAAKLGFRIVDMATVSTEIAQSTTFREHRHDSDAVAMRLDL